MKTAQKENWINLFLGLWLFITPWTFSHNLSSTTAATMNWSFWGVGAIIAVTATLALWDLKPWEEWVNLFLGVYVIFSPILLGFSGEGRIAWNSVIVGAAVAIFSGLAIPVAQKLQKQ